MDKLEIANVIKDIKARISTYRHLSFRHISKVVNNVAHGMAKYDHKIETPAYWIEEVPSEIDQLVTMDIRGFQIEYFKKDYFLSLEKLINTPKSSMGNGIG